MMADDPQKEKRANTGSDAENDTENDTEGGNVSDTPAGVLGGFAGRVNRVVSVGVLSCVACAGCIQNS